MFHQLFIIPVYTAFDPSRTEENTTSKRVRRFEFEYGQSSRTTNI